MKNLATDDGIFGLNGLSSFKSVVMIRVRLVSFSMAYLLFVYLQVSEDSVNDLPPLHGSDEPPEEPPKFALFTDGSQKRHARLIHRGRYYMSLF